MVCIASCRILAHARGYITLLILALSDEFETVGSAPIVSPVLMTLLPADFLRDVLRCEPISHGEK
jgi:hypothetical protein